VLVKIARYWRHCKGGGFARLSGRPAAGGRARPRTAIMISLTICSPAAPTPSRRRRMTTAALAVLALALLPSGSARSRTSSSPPEAAAADPNDTVLARVNGSEIRQSDLALAEEDFAQELKGAPPDVKKEQLIAYLTDVILVSQEAEKQKLGDTNEFKRR